jgi:hypothetical protein
VKLPEDGVSNDGTCRSNVRLYICVSDVPSSALWMNSWCSLRTDAVQSDVMRNKDVEEGATLSESVHCYSWRDLTFQR